MMLPSMLYAAFRYRAEARWIAMRPWLWEHAMRTAMAYV